MIIHSTICAYVNDTHLATSMTMSFRYFLLISVFFPFSILGFLNTFLVSIEPVQPEASASTAACCCDCALNCLYSPGSNIMGS